MVAKLNENRKETKQKREKTEKGRSQPAWSRKFTVRPSRQPSPPAASSLTLFLPVPAVTATDVLDADQWRDGRHRDATVAAAGYLVAPEPVGEP